MPGSIETSAPAHFIEPNDQFRPDFNRLPFQFLHRLADHPLFALPRLLELARTTRRDRPRDLYYDAGPDIRADQRWDQMGPKPFMVEEALHRIETCGAWVTLHQAQKDPEYGALFYECMREFESLTFGHRRATWPRTPNRHVLISERTALGSGPVSRSYLSWNLQRHGVSIEHIRRDRVLHEALTARGGPAAPGPDLRPVPHHRQQVHADRPRSPGRPARRGCRGAALRSRLRAVMRICPLAVTRRAPCQRTE